jgi:predicted ABC-type ATPase
MANLYIIAGCNGAGKTTVSYSVLPEMLECKKYNNQIYNQIVKI